MLTLFHSLQSRSSRMIWLLEELGADYELRYVDIPRMDGSGRPAPANPHPDKKVPALAHDGALVTESAAICLYLTDLHPEAGVAGTAFEEQRIVGRRTSWPAARSTTSSGWSAGSRLQPRGSARVRMRYALTTFAGPRLFTRAGPRSCATVDADPGIALPDGVW